MCDLKCCDERAAANSSFYSVLFEKQKLTLSRKMTTLTPQVPERR